MYMHMHIVYPGWIRLVLKYAFFFISFELKHQLNWIK